MKKIKYTLLLCLFLLTVTLSYSQEQVTPETALKSYLENGDKTFGWQIKEHLKLNEGDVYNLRFTSQNWRDIVWTHQLIIMIPNGVRQNNAMLMIDGGSNKEGEPEWINLDEHDMLLQLGEIAIDNNIVVALLRQAPNQPLFNNLNEDALISYTLHNFQKDGDYSWPLLFPMVKSSIKAMDVVEQVAKQEKGITVDKFIVSGASKRGWTTWLTGANDKRVVAIAPMVIDIINMPVSLNYQNEAYQEFSDQINDYKQLGLLEAFTSEEGSSIIKMIDPYSYRKTLDMPKLILMGTNDPYWVADNVKNYYDSLPGEAMIHYVPNAGHGLNGGAEAFLSVNGFISTLLSKQHLPLCEWDTNTNKSNITLSAQCEADQIIRVELWSAVSSKHDFRQAHWSSSPLSLKGNNKAEYKAKLPTEGYAAFYINFVHKAPNGIEYSTATRIFIVNNSGVL